MIDNSQPAAHRQNTQRHVGAHRQTATPAVEDKATRFRLPTGVSYRTASVVSLLALISLLPLVGLHPLSQATMLTVVVSTLVMIGIGLHRYRPPAPVAWYMLAASAVLFTAGTVIRDVGPWSATGQLLILGEYVGIGAAAWLWLAPRRMFHADLVLDSLLIGLAALLASWTFLISPVVHMAHTFDGTALVRVMYPVIDALLLAVVTHSVVTTGRSETSLRLVHSCLALVLFADLGSNVEAAGYLRFGSDPLLVPRMLAFVLIGLAALHPTMVSVGQPRRIHPHRSRQRASGIAVLLVFASLGPFTGSQLGTLDRVVVSPLLTLLLVGVLARSERAIVHSSRMQRQAQYQANHDMLTDLFNRQALLQEPAVHPSKWLGRPLCLLFIDLDGFKSINDNFGHAVGDELIVQAANRIRHMIRRTDVAARYGGDEFVILGRAPRSEAAVLAERLLAAIAEPFDLSTGPIAISASIGVSCQPAFDEDSVYDLLQQADSAMYYAKEHGAGYVFYDDMNPSGIHHCHPDLHQSPEGWLPETV